MTVTVERASGDTPPAPSQVIEYAVVSGGVTAIEPELPFCVKFMPLQ